jgi:hypothetical protein
MTELQATIFGTKEPVVPHISDIVECSDGTECSRLDALVDCSGGYHRTEEDRHDADVQIVSDLLDKEAEWCDDYCTGDSDYADAYFCIINESSHRWDEFVGQWVSDNWDDLDDVEGFSESEIVALVCDKIDAGFDCEPEYNGSDCYGYLGNGCYLNGFKIEEYETQININDHGELRVLHEERRLDDVLDDVNCDLYISRNRRREKDEETGQYVPVGRETYKSQGPGGDICPYLMGYASISGGWDFVVPYDRMVELVCEVVADKREDMKCRGCGCKLDSTHDSGCPLFDDDAGDTPVEVEDCLK